MTIPKTSNMSLTEVKNRRGNVQMSMDFSNFTNAKLSNFLMNAAKKPLEKSNSTQKKLRTLSKPKTSMNNHPAGTGYQTSRALAVFGADNSTTF